MMTASPTISIPGLPQRARRQGAAVSWLALSLVTLFSGCGDVDIFSAAPMNAGLASGYSAPLTITRGGTYTGRWMSTDHTVPAINIQTSEPVVIENASVTGPGNLIWANCNCAEGVHLTVRNTTGIATDPGVTGAFRGNFLTVVGASSLQVSRNTMSGIFCGVAVVDSKPATLTIANNVAADTEDRKSDGRGGFLPEKGTGHTIILTNVVAPNGAQIAWNQFINAPGKSSVEDVISIYNSQGASANQPIAVHDNYVQGATSTLGKGYAGGGIITDGDGIDKGAPGVTAFVDISNNQVVSTENYGIAIASGHDVNVHDNRVVSAGRTADGQWLGLPDFGTPSAYYLWNFYGSGTFYNNRITKNAGALVKPDGNGMPVRSDMDARSTSAPLHNVVDANDFRAPVTDAAIPTHADEVSEYKAWLAKLQSASQTVGATTQN